MQKYNSAGWIPDSLTYLLSSSHRLGFEAYVKGATDFSSLAFHPTAGFTAGLHFRHLGAQNSFSRYGWQYAYDSHLLGRAHPGDRLLAIFMMPFYYGPPSARVRAG